MEVVSETAILKPKRSNIRFLLDFKAKHKNALELCYGMDYMYTA